jgi:hypothetical protein
MTATYRIKSHDYHTDMGGQIECGDPQTCTTEGHWVWHDDFEFRTLKQAREFDTDEPAFKIYKVRIVEELTEIR